HGVRGTVALNAEVCDDYPQIIEDARALGWEFMGHNQSNARLLHLMAPDEERRVVLATFSRIEKATGHRPKGWLSSGLQESWHTRSEERRVGKRGRDRWGWENKK